MAAPVTVDPDLVEMMTAVFTTHREQTTPDHGQVRWDTSLWRRLDELGLSRLTGSEEHGGSGAGWPEAAELIRAAAGSGVPVPVAEHDLLAGWLLHTAGLPVDSARRTVCVFDENTVGRAVPWAEQAEKVVVAWQDCDAWYIADVATAELTITGGNNAAGEPRDTVTADVAALAGVRVADTVIDDLLLRGALVRGLQVCAALDRILDLSITHTTERIQFGRSLAKFQAVQNLVADIAAEAALARAATEAALGEAVRTDWSGEHLPFLIAVARSCVGHAASVVVRNAHQVHGAIGTTREHRLHEFTRPALAWRAEFGSVQEWDNKLTTAALAAGREGLWALITTTSKGLTDHG